MRGVDVRVAQEAALLGAVVDLTEMEDEQAGRSLGRSIVHRRGAVHLPENSLCARAICRRVVRIDPVGVGAVDRVLGREDEAAGN